MKDTQTKAKKAALGEILEFCREMMGEKLKSKKEKKKDVDSDAPDKASDKERLLALKAEEEAE
jgi:hypothetical protein